MRARRGGSREQKRRTRDQRICRSVGPSSSGGQLRLPILPAAAAVPRFGARDIGGGPKATSTLRLVRLELEDACVRPFTDRVLERLREADRISGARVNRDEVNVRGLQLVLSPRRLVDHIRVASVAVSIAEELLANRGLVLVAHVSITNVSMTTRKGPSQPTVGSAPGE
eukprot:scaffold23304_cov63-Phaeocystis_antarctica.AAC.2